MKNYLAVPDLPLDGKGTQFDLPGGTIFDGDLGDLQADHELRGPVLPRQRHRERRRTRGTRATGTRHPWEGETIPTYTDFDADGEVHAG